MGDSTADARSVAAVASVSMGVNDTSVKSVAAVASVSMDDTAHTARSADAVKRGSEKKQTVSRILTHQIRIFLHRLGS
jgi:hypothetical protein